MSKGRCACLLNAHWYSGIDLLHISNLPETRHEMLNEEGSSGLAVIGMHVIACLKSEV